MKIDTARQLAAQAWCAKTTERIIMDPVLAEEFAKIICATQKETVERVVEFIKSKPQLKSENEGWTGIYQINLDDIKKEFEVEDD